MSVIENAVKAGMGRPMDGTVPMLGGEDIEGIAPEEIKEMMEKVLMTVRPDLGLLYLKLSHFLSLCLPEVDALSEFDDGNPEYKDLWDHTLKVVAGIPPDRVLRWAALFHDIGKLKTKRTDEKGETHFIGHEIVGAKMASRAMKRLCFAPGDGEKIRFLVHNHLRCAQYDSGWTDSAVRRLGKELGELLDDQLALARADITTKHAGRRARYLELLDELGARFERIAEEDAKPPPLPSGLGHHIMKHFGLEPGPEVGTLRRELEERVEAGELEAGREPEYYLDYLNGRRNAGSNSDD